MLGYCSLGTWSIVGYMWIYMLGYCSLGTLDICVCWGSLGTRICLYWVAAVWVPGYVYVELL